MRPSTQALPCFRQVIATNALAVFAMVLSLLLVFDGDALYAVRSHGRSAAKTPSVPGRFKPWMSSTRQSAKAVYSLLKRKARDSTKIACSAHQCDHGSGCALVR